MTPWVAAAIVSGALMGRAVAPLSAQNAPAMSASDGVYTKDQSKRGQAAYDQSCSVCHGSDLMGDQVLKTPPLSGDDFMAHWLNQSVGDLVERISATMPANSPGSLEDSVVIDLVAYLLDYSRFPAGTAELKAGKNTLKTIMIARPMK